MRFSGNDLLNKKPQRAKEEESRSRSIQFTEDIK